MDKMFVKDQDCVSHTLEFFDKNPWYNGQSLFQGHNREFFDALNYSTSIKSECFFKNQGIFFNLFLKKGSTPPCYLHPIVTQSSTRRLQCTLCKSRNPSTRCLSTCCSSAILKYENYAMRVEKRKLELQ